MVREWSQVSSGSSIDKYHASRRTTFNASSVTLSLLVVVVRSRSVAPRWPRMTARLHRSAGGRLLSRRIWSNHLLRGRPGRRFHWLLGGRPSDRPTWQLSALWTGTSSCNVRLATWPKRELQRRLTVDWFLLVGVCQLYTVLWQIFPQVCHWKNSGNLSQFGKNVVNNAKT